MSSKQNGKDRPNPIYPWVFSRYYWEDVADCTQGKDEYDGVAPRTVRAIGCGVELWGLSQNAVHAS